MSISYGGDNISFADGTNIGSGRTGFVNRIINGAMVIDQRNAGASVTPTTSGASAFATDRFAIDVSQNTKITAQQNAGSVTPPVGFTNYLGITSSSAYSVASGDYFVVNQRIEGFNIADLGWGTANAKTITLSFQVYSSLTGTFGGALRNSAANRSYPFSYSIPVANTWTTISVIIAGDTTGTWLTNNSLGMYVYFGLGIGSTLSGTAGAWSGGNYLSATGATSVVGTSGATFYITGVDLRAGTYVTAPTWEFRSYGQELALCQRYYTMFGSNGFAYCGFASGFANNTTTAELYLKYPVAMRSAPTLVYSGVRVDTSSGSMIPTGGTLYGGTDSAMWQPNGTGSMTTGYGAVCIGNNNTSAYISLSSEL